MNTIIYEIEALMASTEKTSESSYQYITAWIVLAVMITFITGNLVLFYLPIRLPQSILDSLQNSSWSSTSPFSPFNFLYHALTVNCAHNWIWSLLYKSNPNRVLPEKCRSTDTKDRSTHLTPFATCVSLQFKCKDSFQMAFQKYFI